MCKKCRKRWWDALCQAGSVFHDFHDLVCQSEQKSVYQISGRASLLILMAIQRASERAATVGADG